jgi:hypothetical protein
MFTCLLATQQNSELYRKGVDLPTPAALLGDLDVDAESLVTKKGKPELTVKDVLGRVGDLQIKPMLRETKAHEELLYHFTICVITQQKFKEQVAIHPHSEYLWISLECFLVIAYVNGYDKWMWECEFGPPKKKNRKRKKRSEDDDDEEDAGTTSSGDSDTSPTDTSPTTTQTTTGRTRFTEDALGAGKYKGWSKGGILLYNLVHDVLEEQRTKDVAGYDKKMKNRFLSPDSSKKVTNGPAEPRVRSSEAKFLAMLDANPLATVLPV